jgi:hypothetical protein
MITKRKIAIATSAIATNAIVATVRKTSSIIGHLLLKLNARSIDDPAEPVNCPLRPKNGVAPLPLLTADPVK